MNGANQYRILQSNQQNYRGKWVAPAKVARIAGALEQPNWLVPLLLWKHHFSPCHPHCQGVYHKINPLVRGWGYSSILQTWCSQGCSTNTFATYSFIDSLREAILNIAILNTGIARKRKGVPPLLKYFQSTFLRSSIFWQSGKGWGVVLGPCQTIWSTFEVFFYCWTSLKEFLIWVK